MKTSVQKWGNSLAVRIPRNITNDTKVFEGSRVNIMVENGNIILSPETNEYSLKELLKKITNESIHSEISTGEAVGGEVW
jgi:antitoxin MazE